MTVLFTKRSLAGGGLRVKVTFRFPSPVLPLAVVPPTTIWYAVPATAVKTTDFENKWHYSLRVS